MHRDGSTHPFFTNPVEFVEEFMGCKLTLFQKDFINFVYKHKDKQIIMWKGRGNWRTWMVEAFLSVKEYEVMEEKKMMLNPDKEHVAKIRTALKNNDGYCPCELEKTPDTKCPCKNMRECRICHCMLYVEREDGHEQANSQEKGNETNSSTEESKA